MVSLGPFSMKLVVLLLALAIAVAAGALVARRARVGGQKAVKVFGPLLDMLLVGALVARAAFVLAWLPQYRADPWAILRIGDGGFLVWAGIAGALAYGVWHGRKVPPLRRPLMVGAVAGLVAWALLAGALARVQQARVQLPGGELTTLQGDRIRLSQLSGRPMVVNLWATWCPPCRREMPVLARAQQQQGHVTFVFVNQGETAPEVKAYLAGEGLDLGNVLLDPSSSAMREAGSQGLPTTLFFDAGGRLLDTHMGELTDATLVRKLRQSGDQ